MPPSALRAKAEFLHPPHRSFHSFPASPADGPKGKKVILIVHGDHPWTTAYINGAKKACEFFGMELEAWSPNWDVNVQNQLIDQAINARPDAIGLIPLNAESAVQQFRKINEAGIPREHVELLQDMYLALQSHEILTEHKEGGLVLVRYQEWVRNQWIMFIGGKLTGPMFNASIIDEALMQNIRKEVAEERLESRMRYVPNTPG